MTDLYVVTGFLGAGKSTFLRQFVRLFEGKKIRLIINDFGPENVDGALLEELGIEQREITGGSVFCACRIDQFEKALRTFVTADTDAVIAEASGLSDPAGIRDFLRGTDMYGNIRYRGSICLVDAVRFHKVYARSRICVRQLAAADIVLINKIDQASPGELDLTRKLVREQRPDLTVYETSFGRPDAGLLEELRNVKADEDRALPLIEDLTTRKMTVLVRDGIALRSLEGFLKYFADMTFRIKGFVMTEQGPCLVDCVGSRISIGPYSRAIPEGRAGKLVILSGAGMPVKKTVKEAVQWYRDDTAILS